MTIDNIGSGTLGTNVGSVAFIDTSNRGLANSGEVVYAFVGTSATAPTAFLTAASNNTFAAAGSIANTGLTAGTSAVEFNNGNDVFAFTGARDNQGGFAAYASIINNPANWIFQDGTGDQSIDGTAPDLPFSTTAFTLGGGDAIPPTLSSSAPTDNATDVAATTNIVLNFSETVQKGAGNILIKLVADDSVVQTIDVNNAAVGISGSTVTINPPADLAPGTAYYVTIPTGAFEDLAGNDFAGLTSATDLNFTTVAAGNVVGGITILEEAASLQGAQGATSTTPPAGSNALHLTRIGSYDSGNGAGGAESVSYDHTSHRAFVTNAAADRIDIVDLSNPAHPVKFGEIPLGALTGYGEVNSVAVKNGVVAVAIQNSDATQDGVVRLYDTNGNFIKQITAGVLPDQLTFSPDGSKLLVANEAEPASATANAAGSISIIDMSGGAAAATVINTIGFGSLDGHEAQLESLGLSLLGQRQTGAIPVDAAQLTASKDIEPEYIAVSPDGTRAYVTLQEVNAVAVIDLTDPAADRPIAILPLGSIDRSLPGNEFDGSDRDFVGNNNGAINLQNWPVHSLLQPDAIASFQVGGVTYFITANEGDARTSAAEAAGGPVTYGAEEVRLSAVTLDPAVFPNAATLQDADSIGRLNIINHRG